MHSGSSFLTKAASLHVPIAYSAFNQSSHFLLFFNDKTRTIEELYILDNSSFSKAFNEAHFNNFYHVFESEVSTCVPSSLFEADNKEDYINALLSTPCVDPINDVEIPEFNFYLVYPKLRSENFSIHSHNSIHIWKALLYFQKANLNSQNEFSVFAHQTNKFLYLSIFKDKKLIFINSFRCETENDVAYYLLYVLEQHQLSLNQIALYYNEEMPIENSPQNLLNEFFLNIKQLHIPYAISDELKEKGINQTHCIANISSYLCA
jgi:hypothetical protein